MEPTPAAASLHSAFERPANIVMTVCQMILGAALTITLILKVYFLIFSDLACEADALSLGNMIRCTDTLTIVAQYLLLIAGFRFAALMFARSFIALVEPLMIALVGVFLLFVADISLTSATWFLPLIVAVMFGTIAACLAALRFFTMRDD